MLITKPDKTMTTTEYSDHFFEYVNDVEEGIKNPLDAYLHFKQIEAALKAAMQRIEEAAVSERRAYGKEEVIRHGMRIELVEGRKTYSYKHIALWQEIDEKRKQIEKAAKGAAEFGAHVITNDGEEIEPAEIRFGKDHLRISVAK